MGPARRAVEDGTHCYCKTTQYSMKLAVAGYIKEKGLNARSFNPDFVW
jgi:hypothetical protein